MRFYLVGASGRMGKEILQVAEERGDTCVRGFGSKDQVSFDEKANVIIDFSTAKNFKSLLEAAVKSKTAFMSGTTGLTAEDFAALQTASQSIAVLWAANTSFGIQVVRSLLTKLDVVKDWDFHITESHHIHKKDSPSGTALVLKSDLEKAIHKKVPDCSAIRGGGIYGEHSIQIMGPSETIRIEHVALSRKVFAEGALKAASFLQTQSKGLYTMSDVLEGAK